MTEFDRRTLLLKGFALCLVALLPASKTARADKGRRGRNRDRDHDEAREEYDSGNALALADVLERVKPHIDGEIIEIEFEVEHGLPVYEFKYIDRTGRVRELLVDARDGTILRDRPE